MHVIDSVESKSERGRRPREVRPARVEPLAVLPIFFKLRGKKAVLAGGNDPALWKAELLAAAGANVHVFADSFDDGFEALAASPPAGSIVLEARAWRDGDLDGAAIAIGSLEDAAEIEQFVAAAKKAGAIVNVIDKPAYCEFQFGSLVNRSPLIVGISTDGAAPIFGQSIRSRIEATLPDGFKAWAGAAKTWRSKVMARAEDKREFRRRFWELFSDRAFSEAARVPTDRDLNELLDAAGTSDDIRTGFVSLVGAGPGDPELLTMKAVRALRNADVILYDDLVNVAMLEFGRREAKRIHVGKTGYGPACKQTEINALMLTLAKDGERVVRLKSGDPMIFGRGGEEIAALEQAGIAFEIVPGVSAAQGAAARLQTSLTHRDHARRVQFVTGHSREGRLPTDLNWQALADPRATTVVYMALHTIRELCERLQNSGLSAGTPAVAIFSATRAEETVISRTIGELPSVLESGGFSGPCLVLIGEALQDAPGAHPKPE